MKSVEKIEPFTVLVSNKLLDFFYDNKDISKETTDYPYPVYCMVIGLNGGVDEKTSELVHNFLSSMCTDYDNWGQFVLKEFQQFFVEQIETKSNFYVKSGELNEQQAKIFRRELGEYISLNEKDKLMED